MSVHHRPNSNGRSGQYCSLREISWNWDKIERRKAGARVFSTSTPRNARTAASHCRQAWLNAEAGEDTARILVGAALAEAHNLRLRANVTSLSDLHSASISMGVANAAAS